MLLVPSWPRPARLRAALSRSLLLALLVLPAVVRAEPNATPATHWGASMYPAAQPGVVFGFEWLAFTEFGKDICLPEATDCTPGLPVHRGQTGSRDRYNFQDQTVGLNLFTATYTASLARHHLNGSNLTYAFTLVAGFQSDLLPEFYQNDIIHARAGLADIPRGNVACSRGDFKVAKCLPAGIGAALNYRVLSLDQGSDGETAFRESPLFVGAGGMLSTVELDAYAQFGVQRFGLFPHAWSWTSYFDIALSSLLRGGILKGTQVFPDIASRYVALDGAVAFSFSKHAFPVLIELGIVSSTGHFIVAPRAPGDQSPPAPEALAETFYRLRVELGTFTFETFNDSIGGKDKGPSYGVRLLWNLLPGTTEGDWTHKRLRQLFDRMAEQ